MDLFGVPQGRDGGTNPPTPPPPPPRSTFLRSKKKKKKRKEKQRKKKDFKAETIKRLSPRSKRYNLSHARASGIQKCFLSANQHLADNTFHC